MGTPAPPESPSRSRRRRPAESLRDPEWTKRQLLDAAQGEFSENGLNGARVNDIATVAGVNKQLLYYYFGDKDGLYRAVLERAYGRIRAAEQALDLEALPARDAMTRFMGFTFDYLTENRYFVALLSDENIHRARHVKDSPHLKELHDRLLGTIGGIIARGVKEGVFRDGVDPVQLYVSVASLCYFYYSNIHTLGAIFGRDLAAPRAVNRRRQHVIEFVLSFLKAPEETS